MRYSKKKVFSFAIAICFDHLISPEDQDERVDVHFHQKELVSNFVKRKNITTNKARVQNSVLAVFSQLILDHGNLGPRMQKSDKTGQ